MALVGIIIVGLAAYIFTHLSGLDMTQGIVLVAIAIVALIIIMGVIFILFRSLTKKP
jgi:hypothetical protein